MSHDDGRQTEGSGEFERRLREALRTSSEALDGRVRSRLTQARYAALEQRAPRSARAWRGWVPAGAVAMAVLATLLYVGRGTESPTANPAKTGSLDVLELVADADAFELNAAPEQELDYEFYEWAAAAGQETDAGVGT